ncbi:MAG: ABC transporter permease [Gammaproteobacteria bacterium]|nr:ABC transporter permease [Gammaproteobacteria bacterium]MCY4211384.1 ABC transporter permease [Gammaproteobacteria bacterium]MCY4281661.1 ABC transporter permease [Gammaproteobacteria bacterium]MCY4337730.1 ABC transporter permease [Gammaproteobacteria bacterium]
MTPGSRSWSRLLAVLRGNAREAIDSLRKARLRTVLGLIGIMIGISSVITMVSLGEIAKAKARKEFEALGTDILVIRKSFEGAEAEAAINVPDALALAPQTPSITIAAPRISGYGSFQYAGKEVGRGSLQGVSASFLRVNKLSLQEGRFISDLDVDRYYCAIGAGVADSMRAAGGRQLIGQHLEIDGTLFTIVGVLNEAVDNYALPVQVSANESVFVPISTAGRVVANAEIDVIIARSAAGVHYRAATADVNAYFQSRSPDLKLEVVTAQELIARMEAQMRIMTLLLGAVGSISLIVGGVGVMNIMLVSVAERRREIAIRRALGARRRDIQSQFLIESVILTVAGGVLGIILGLLATWGICRFTGWDYLISGASLLSGLGTATAVGLFFGFQPARQAARLDPVTGLQGD